ncbi:MAG: ATP-dependent RecD-like DNA helicase [Clostridiales bacterium]|nr:ATP-dependent RecD-like DNA helicase [Clostridiales bacterium]
MTIKGDIDEIRFRNDENGYTIVVLDVAGEPIIATGVFPPVVEGQTLELEGDYVVHKKYGRQFSAVNAQPINPSGEDGIIRYLGSGVIRGIGPVLALKIVGMFGRKTFDIIRHSPGRLARVNGISQRKAGEIHDAYEKIRDMQDAVMALQAYDMTLNLAMRIYKAYGKETVSAVKANPYRLIEDVEGIGFLTADRIARKLGIEGDSAFRIRAGIIYVLKESAQKEGNTCLPAPKLTEGAAALLTADPEAVAREIDELLIERRLREYQAAGERLLMLPGLYHTEKNAAVLIGRLIDSVAAECHDCAPDIAAFEAAGGIVFHEKQRTAIERAVNAGLVVVTGGPGTGKTTIITCILDILDKLQRRVVLMAPTGRAAKRMQEATGREAGTVHRTLGLQREGSDRQAKQDFLYADAVIVDEMSMVDIYLFESLLKRISKGTRLVLVGDRDQLPSVGAGSVLGDLIESGKVATVQLDRIYRQDGESTIVENAHAVNRGDMPDIGQKSDDFFFIRSDSPQKSADKTVEMAAARIPARLGIPFERVQVLCPLKNGPAGTIALNRLLQKRLNPQTRGGVEVENTVFYAGDKVMHVVNNYDIPWRIASGYTYIEGTGIFNGDMGTVLETDGESGDITVLFEDGRQAVYDRTMHNELILAYAITVHKSQGCEFDAVVLPLTPGSPVIMTRNLLYTAITRAKRMVVLVGEPYVLKKMVQNDYVATRWSLLKYFLADASAALDDLYRAF